MSEFLLNIKILMDILIKKETNLTSLLNISLNQEDLLRAERSSQNKDLTIFNNQMNEEKQLLIDDILKLDKAFENTFIKVSVDFEKNASLNKLQIKALQSKISNINNLDKSIRRQELINKNIITRSNKAHKEAATKSQIQYMLNQYKRNTKDSLNNNMH